MSKYINGGIAREITITLRKEEELTDVLNHLSDYLNLDLYEMKVYGSSVYLELDLDLLKKELANFLQELQDMHIPEFLDYEGRIQYIRKHQEDSILDVLEKCDDIFDEVFQMQNVFSLNDSAFYIDVTCSVFYFDGPFEGGNFDNLLRYLHILQKNVLKNPLKDALCFGISES